MAAAVVRVRWSDLSLEWLCAVADLVQAIDDADPIMVEGPVREAADNVQAVVYRARQAGEA